MEADTAPIHSHHHHHNHPHWHSVCINNNMWISTLKELSCEWSHLYCKQREWPQFTVINLISSKMQQHVCLNSKQSGQSSSRAVHNLCCWDQHPARISRIIEVPLVSYDIQAQIVQQSKISIAQINSSNHNPLFSHINQGSNVNCCLHRRSFETFRRRKWVRKLTNLKPCHQRLQLYKSCFIA